MQAYVSDSIKDFPFMQTLQLSEYINPEEPCLFIGCYSQEDFHRIVSHTGKSIILWSGQDSITAIMNGWYQQLKKCIHVTWLDNVERALRNFVPIKLVPPVLLGGDFKPSVFGSTIFAYCPATAPEYHRIDLIEALKIEYPQYTFYIGDGSITQENWLNNNFGNWIYDQCFIGLCLSGFAGGGQTVLQMGLKGRLVVNNVVNSPNTISWNSIDDIKYAIDKQSQMIGKESTGMANLVYTHLSKTPTWLEI